MPGCLASRWPAVLAAIACVASARGASAHDLGFGGSGRGGYSVSRSVWRLHGSALDAEIKVPPDVAAHLGDPLAPNNAPPPSDAAAEAGITSRIEVHRGGEACDGRVDEPGRVVGDDFHVRLRYACPAGGDDPIVVRLAFLGLLGPRHRHLVDVDDGGTGRTEVLLDAQPSFEVRPGSGRWLPFSFLRMGVEHIVGGYDHLVFLFGLILLGGRFRSLLATVTAFTLAHSITLALAALDVWNPGSRFVEPAIGATIAYVGIENLFLREPRGRWRITFFLGLVHGFGFAGALAEAGLSRAHLVPALLLFNLGVELGQMAVLAVVLPLVLLARRRAWFVARGVPVASVGIAVTGMALFVIRLW